MKRKSMMMMVIVKMTVVQMRIQIKKHVFKISTAMTIATTTVTAPGTIRMKMSQCWFGHGE